MVNTNFRRGVTNNKFIELLNLLKKDPNTFWSKALQDDRLFIAIRDNYLNVYFYGQSVVEIRYNISTGSLKYKTHKKYIGINDKGYKYVDEEELANIDSFIDNIKQFCHIEKTCSYNYLLDSKRCIDVEITFSGVKKSIDFVLLSNSGELEFYEAKHASNPEIVSSTTPRVFEQTDTYIKLLKQNSQSIIDSYQIVIQNYGDLGITVPHSEVNSIGNPLVKLIIFGEKSTLNWNKQKNTLYAKYKDALVFTSSNEVIR